MRPRRRPTSAGMVTMFFWVTVVIMELMIVMDQVIVNDLTLNSGGTQLPCSPMRTAMKYHPCCGSWCAGRTSDPHRREPELVKGASHALAAEPSK